MHSTTYRLWRPGAWAFAHSLAATRKRSMQEIEYGLRRTPLPRTPVNKELRKLRTASQLETPSRPAGRCKVGLTPLCLLGGSRGCWGRRHFGGDRSDLLCLVHAAPEHIANPDGTDHNTNKDQYPVVPHKVEVHQRRGGGCG